jgi:hypothetical protein
MSENMAKCAYCHVELDRETAPRCPVCGAVHHADCWDENGGCAVLGCVAAPDAAHPQVSESLVTVPVAAAFSAGLHAAEPTRPLSPADFGGFNATAVAVEEIAPVVTQPVGSAAQSARQIPPNTVRILPPAPNPTVRHSPRGPRVRTVLSGLALIGLPVLASVATANNALAPVYGHLANEPEVDTERDTAYDEGRSDGYDEGRSDGYDEGRSDGYDTGYDVGYDEGYDSGYYYDYSNGWSY